MDGAPSAFVPGDEESDTVRAIIARLAGHAPQGPLVLLNPNASDLLPLRRWATDRFIELGKQILRQWDTAIIGITGAPCEREAADNVARAIDAHRCINLAGQTTLRQLMVLYTIADVLVTNDSGPGHFSSMTDLDTIVLFGPETPALYGPLGAHTHVVWENMACSPCVNVLNHRFSPCNDNVCMQRISVETVYARVNDLLQRRTQRKTNSLPVLAAEAVSR
jgi:ADP-heptose:LPS heptosyltransferase